MLSILIVPIPSVFRIWDLLDLAYRTTEEMWLLGGSDKLLCSFDGGQTGQRDQDFVVKKTQSLSVSHTGNESSEPQSVSAPCQTLWQIGCDWLRWPSGSYCHDGR
ncbi:MAG: hypothetical protein F6K31_41795 [Symploca sp. SIO2G7]|nr:hypothetical protein [Symploca sp. SIO2G7]